MKKKETKSRFSRYSKGKFKSLESFCLKMWGKKGTLIFLNFSNFKNIPNKKKIFFTNFLEFYFFQNIYTILQTCIKFFLYQRQNKTDFYLKISLFFSYFIHGRLVRVNETQPYIHQSSSSIQVK